MQIAPSAAATGRVAAWAPAGPRHLLSGQGVLVAVIAGVTWLALVGGVLSSYIIANGPASGHGGAHASLPPHVEYNVLDAAPTSFGSLAVMHADLTPAADSVRVDVSLNVINTHDTQLDAPRVEDLRVINTDGVATKLVPGRWSGPAALAPHTSGYIDLAYLAPRDAGVVWLEYRDPKGQLPIRVPLGSTVAAANQATQPADASTAAASLGAAR